MKKILLIVLAFLLTGGSVWLISRQPKKTAYYSLEDEIQKKIERKKRGEGTDKEARIKGYKDYIDGITIPFGKTKSPAPADYLWKELKKVKAAGGKFRPAEKSMDWVERGPANVGGRTRGLIVDPDDPSHLTWYAGSASGGMWKTTDGGETWVCLSDGLPYQTTTTLAMAKSNHNVIYMGTGESFPGGYITGGGVLRSTDRGETWTFLEATGGNEDFRYTNRIEVDPENDSIVLVATTTGIFKSADAGQTWVQKYASGDNSVEDLVADTSDFNYMYAGVNSLGVIRSTDAGETWELASDGIGARLRIELAISPTNPDKIYASVETADGKGSLYSSFNRGDSWQKVVNSEDDNFSFHGDQGMYDNTIAVHPYDENTVFFGGVDLWKATAGTTIQEGTGEISGFIRENTESFLDFVNFTGNLYPGMNTGDNEGATNLEDGDFVTVEIRFGPGLSQKAHRFFVPLQATSGVPASDYSYKDYVEVPFEVWDVTNNRQLMCSFRDQERDGAFNLYERTGDAYGQLGREYLFINAVTYNPTTPDPNITVQGGRSYKLIYFFWPTLATGGSWEPANLPASKISVVWTILQARVSEIANVSDAYGQYGGINNYVVSGTNTTGLHADHHELIMIPVNDVTEDFWVLNANDGGLGLSQDNGITFTQKLNNYYTTQFYGVSKKPYRNEYIGGMQDNGTWQSPVYQEATSSSRYTRRLGGDGLETMWNQQDSNRLMGTIYNRIYRSLNHGRGWAQCDQGIDELPFIVKLTPMPSNNNIVFTVGTGGVYLTGNFAETDWGLKALDEGWLGNYTAITSSHQVKISPANENIIWAGGGMASEYGLKMFVSTNRGTSFSPVGEPDVPVPALISGLATHPTEPNTAYVMYSLYGYPKIFRTTDLGETWEDLTKVNASGVSENGFPNVGVKTLIVFPDTTDMIWAGTEVGIMESLDNGETWHYLESGFPTVDIFQMFIQDNQVVVSTYGRGIWTWQFGPEVFPDALSDLTIDEGMYTLYPNPSSGVVNLRFSKAIGQAQVSAEVYSLDGKLAWTWSGNDARAGNVLKFDLSGLKKGIYIVNLRMDKKRYAERIILR